MREKADGANMIAFPPRMPCLERRFSNPACDEKWLFGRSSPTKIKVLMIRKLTL
ncbi:hypothetical protein H6F96_30520 [Microcoleus sp. FACHB-53]|nr:hypothetical protein [Microcoleus sp. FACHB-53]